MPAANVTVTAQFHYDPPYIPSYYDIYFDGNENDISLHPYPTLGQTKYFVFALREIIV